MNCKKTRMMDKASCTKTVKSYKAFRFLAVFLTLSFYFSMASSAFAGCGCEGCWPGDTNSAKTIIHNNHVQGRKDINTHTTDEFRALREWMTTTFLKEQVIPAQQQMTEQLSTATLQQAGIIGMFIDAKHQLETQRLFQELQVQAHKDYQPSGSFCTFGTNVRSLAHSEALARYNALAMSRRQQARHLGQVNMGGARDSSNDKSNRWGLFTSAYCDPQDNNWEKGKADTGLTSVCKEDPKAGVKKDPNRTNIDIDYTRLVENRRTIDFAWPFSTFNTNPPDGLDVMALGNNLYGHNVMFREISESNIGDKDKDHMYESLRSSAAKRSVAENSFNAIVAMKSAGSAGGDFDEGAGSTETYKYLGAVLKDLGIPDGEVKEYLGQAKGDSTADPSYYAQLEILAKKIYQSPGFYANLYDTPANVKRKSAALKAIELMLDREIYESQLRQEMSLSVLLSSKLNKSFKDTNKNLGNQ